MAFSMSDLIWVSNTSLLTCSYTNYGTTRAVLKGILCHTTRADCLQMNQHAPTWQRKTGHGERLISSRLVFKFAHWGSLCSEFNVSSIVCTLYPLLKCSYLLVAHSWRSCASQLDHQQNVCAACVNSTSAYSHALYHDTGHAHTSCTQFNWIFELMSSVL